jgi:Ca2+-binding EF-hand superfamily protein
LKTHLYGNDLTKEKYFPLEKQNKYLNNFKLFDRNYDEVLDYDELKEFMVSVGQIMPDAELEDFYKHLKQDNGITNENGRQ